MPIYANPQIGTYSQGAPKRATAASVMLRFSRVRSGVFFFGPATESRGDGHSTWIAFPAASAPTTTSSARPPSRLTQ
eukprot:11853507-Prorocentrum_lima.AAC.1